MANVPMSPEAREKCCDQFTLAMWRTCSGYPSSVVVKVLLERATQLIQGRMDEALWIRTGQLVPDPTLAEDLEEMRKAVSSLNSTAFHLVQASFVNAGFVTTNRWSVTYDPRH